jgi:hypothetical protein
MSDGISTMELAALPPKLRRIMSLLIRQGEMTQAALFEALEASPEEERLSQVELEAALETLCERSWLIEIEEEGQPKTYKINLRRKAGTRITSPLTQGIWDLLDLGDEQERPSSREKKRPTRLSGSLAVLGEQEDTSEPEQATTPQQDQPTGPVEALLGRSGVYRAAEPEQEPDQPPPPQNSAARFTGTFDVVGGEDEAPAQPPSHPQAPAARQSDPLSALLKENEDDEDDQDVLAKEQA